MMMSRSLPSVARALAKKLEGLETRLTSNGVFFAMMLVVLAHVVVAGIITVLNSEHYLTSYSFCVQVECFRRFPSAFDVQIALVKLGIAAASFIALIFGSYLALRSYLTSQQVGAFGNQIAHVGLFERFVALELSRRKRLNPGCVDVYAIYQLMFPKNHPDSRFASVAFVQAVQEIYGVVLESSTEHDASKDFTFERHRRRMITAIGRMHIEMDGLPRIEFLEVEDELLDFLRMLCVVFAPPDVDALAPQRSYR